MSGLHIQLFGSARICLKDTIFPFGQDQRYQLLAYLAYVGKWVKREHLAVLFWGDKPQSVARRNLRKLLHKTQRLEWLQDLEVEADRLCWKVKTDVAMFNEAYQEARWLDATELYQGSLLNEFTKRLSPDFTDWLTFEREHLYEKWRTATLNRANGCLAKREYQLANDALSGLLEQDALDEEALRLYMLAAAQEGKRMRALKAYRVFEERLAEEVGLTPTVKTLETLRAVEREETSSVSLEKAYPLGVVTTVSDTLPHETTPFIGRDLELGEVAYALEEGNCRLLTLLGPGGVGKSRVALQAAREFRDRYPGGVGFVALEAVTSALQIPSAIARSLAFSLEGTSDPLHQVKQQIGTKRMLLILDNFEQLVLGAGQCSEFLKACPNLQILVTSRERLRLQEEQVLLLAGLAYSPKGTPLNEAQSSDAVRLFLERARRVRPEFELTEKTLPHVLAICDLVAGLPLGLELAAVWVRLISCKEIAEEIHGNLDFLADASQNVPERHQSLRATFEHSWALLTPEEQRVLARLSVFRGGFTREAATLVADASLPVLASLVDRSLLRLTTEGRYDRHPLLFQYTQEKLAVGTEAGVRAKHAAYYHRLLQTHGAVLLGTDMQRVLNLLENDLENIRVAWRWAAEQGAFKLLAQSALPLMLFYEKSARYQEGLELLSDASISQNQHDRGGWHAVGMLEVARASLQHALGHHQEAKEGAQRGVDLLRSTSKGEGYRAGLRTLGSIAFRSGAYIEAKRHFKEIFELVKSWGDVGQLARALNNLAIAEEALGEYQEAKNHLAQALELNRQLNDLHHVTINLTNLGKLLYLLAEPEAAEPLLQEGLRLAKQTHFPEIVPYLYVHLASVACDLAHFKEAERLSREGLEMLGKSEHKGIQTDVLRVLGRAVSGKKEYAQADIYFLESLELAWNAREYRSVLATLLELARSWLQRDNLVLAAELLKLVQMHEATEHFAREEARELLENVKAQSSALAADVQPEALPDLARTVEQILKGA